MKTTQTATVEEAVKIAIQERGYSRFEDIYRVVMTMCGPFAQEVVQAAIAEVL